MPVGPRGNAPPLNTIDTLIHTEAQKFGVPDWIAFPLVSAESSKNPNAPGGGFLQIQPGYPNPRGFNPATPQGNLDVGFYQLGQTYRAQGSPGPSLGAFENVIAGSGFDTWNGWQTEGQGTSEGPAAIQANYINQYRAYQASTGTASGQGDVQGITGSTPVLGGITNIGGDLGSLGNALNPGNILTGIGDWLGKKGWKVAVVLGALVLLFAAGRHMIAPKEHIVPVPV